MTNHSIDPDDARPEPESTHGDDQVEAVFITRNTIRTDRHFYLERLFLCWAWEAGYRDWKGGVRALARALRGLERSGLIERRTVRRAGKPTYHGFALTDDGGEAVIALSGVWIEEEPR